MERLADRSGTVRALIVPKATPAPLTAALLAKLSPVFAAFMLVLVAACANISNVMLARANSRHREMGIRLSLGAARGRIVGQLMIEGLLISAAAGIAALALTSLLLRAGVAAFYLTLPPSFATVARVLPLDLDHRVFFFTFALAAGATVMFALLPALQTTRLDLTNALRGEIGRDVRESRLRNLFVISQVAVSLALIVVAATIVRNGSALRSAEIGFETGTLASVEPRARAEALIPRAHAALSADPRVASAAVTSHNPLTSDGPKIPLRQPDGRLVVAAYTFVSPNYFETLQVPVVRGRTFDAREGEAEAPVAIVSASAARALWPGQDPLDQSLRIWIPPDDRSRARTREFRLSSDEFNAQSYEVSVVGVTEDVVGGLVYDTQRVQIYLPTSPGAARARALLVRVRSPIDVNPDGLRQLLGRIDPDPLAFAVLPLDEALALQLYPVKAGSWIGLLLSALALLLSVSGLYGVVSYRLTQRMREIGIRMALGATPGAIVRLVMTQSGRLVATGALLGFGASFSALAVLNAIVPLDNVVFLDAGSFSIGLIVVGIATAAATFIPSRRATQVDPSQVLRAEG
jgi:predicted permease